MLSLGALAFTSPWMLAAAVALPLLWWLLRLTPPAPLVVRFPAIRLLRGLDQEEETPARTPLWLVALRLGVAAFIILALAHPLLNPVTPFTGSGPLVLVVDTGWAAGPGWAGRQRMMGELIDKAERDGRRVILLETAPSATGAPPRTTEPLAAAEARDRALTFTPHPWPTDREAATRALDTLRLEGSANVWWLSDGLADGHAERLAERLRRLGALTLVRDPVAARAGLLRAPEFEGSNMTLRVERAGGDARDIVVRGRAEDGRVLLREVVAFGEGETAATAQVPLPLEIRNRLMRLEIDGEASAGAAFLLDERWRRRPVGLVATGQAGGDLPLLGERYYLERALGPFSEVHAGSIEKLLEAGLAVIVLPDLGALPPPTIEALGAWIEAGGVTVRFAGPRLAQGTDTLVPVALRRGGRAFGGAMSWSQPATLAPFAAATPFAGLTVPDDVTVTRQVLAQPSPDLEARTWVSLSDGTPLVTAERRGTGWLVLFHTTANPDWSDLPLSGLFVRMLQRLVGLSQGVATEGGDAPLPPLEILDGFGHPQPPPTSAIAIPANAIEETVATARTPPGFYGEADAKRALNLATGIGLLGALPAPASGVAQRAYEGGGEIDLKPWLLAAALALGIVDLLLSLALRGVLTWRRAAASLALVAFAGFSGGTMIGDATASEADDMALAATLETRLAYVRTGNDTVDMTSEAGLRGLSRLITERTSVELGEPIGVDLARDELAFFPLLYWPITPDQPVPGGQTVRRVNDFLGNGGMILFDTRDQQSSRQFGLAQEATSVQVLRRILGRLNIPSLVPVPEDHVLTKSFYLLQEFPGRWSGGVVWVEVPAENAVSSVVIGGNDWAAAWAVDEGGRHMYAVLPDAEEQREVAYRFGINLIMYILTGNYKADQVHFPAILERLGQ